MLIIPWGYEDIVHEKSQQMTRMAYKMVNAVKWGTRDRELYVPGTAYQVFDRWGFAGGATDDWYSSLGITFSYTWELPGQDLDYTFRGFKLPPKNIIRVGFLNSGQYLHLHTCLCH